MPEIKPVERYIAALSRIERRMVRGSLQLWQAARAELLAAISDGKRTPALLPAVLTQLLQGTGQQVTVALSGETRAIGDAVARLVEAQIGDVPAAAAQDVRLDLSSWQAATTGQMLAELNRLQASDADTAEIQMRLITGDDGRAGLWSTAKNGLQLATELALWSSANGHLARTGKAIEARSGVRYQKQAIAAIDERTTDCCLRVHGQVQALDKPFTLTGTPRFADRVMNPPFHWRCRTASTLYLPEMESRGVPTSAMRDAARDELDARQRSRQRTEIHPAGSTSRR